MTIHRPLRTVARLLVASLAALVGLGASPASAGWPPSTVRTRTGALQAAVLGHSFVVVSGIGTGGTSYSASKLLSGTTLGQVDLVNTGTVALELSGTVSLTTFLSTTVTIARCTAAWSAGACPGTQTTLMFTLLSARTNVDWQSAPPVPPGQAVHLKVTLGGSVANQVTLTATVRAGRAPGDRTRA